ncbi:MAG: tyrosine-type recombinase/integrase [Geminicoccaceae bacterium]
MPPLHNKHWKKPKYVHVYQSKKGVYTYYRRDGLKLRIYGEPGTAEWFANYEKMHSGFEKGQTRQGPMPGSVDSAIIAYKKSDRYDVLRPSTKERYRYALQKLSDVLGELPLSSITRRAVVRLQDKIAETQPRNAIEVVKVLRLVFLCAMDLGEVDTNPAEGVKKPARYKAKQHEAWTEEQIATFLAGARPVWRRAVMVALYTGLRRGDLVRLSRSHVKNGWIEIDIEKTSGQTAVPIRPELAEELDRPMPTASLMLVPTARGQQMRPDSLTHGIQNEWKRLGVENGPPIHGLRRSAIIRLLEAGCSVEEVRSITDQSKRMVEYYAAGKHRREVAAGAMIKLGEHRGTKVANSPEKKWLTDSGDLD